MSAATLEGAVVRLAVTSVALVSLLIVVAGSGVAGLVVVQRDDELALALGRTLAIELEELKDIELSQAPYLVEDELNEHRWFARDALVIHDGVRLAGVSPSHWSASWADDSDTCSSERVSQRWSRVCAIRVDERTAVLIITPLAPLLGQLIPVVEAIAVVAILSVLLFTLFGRRATRRRLAPLRALQRTIARLPALGAERRLPKKWGAREIDQLARTFNELLARIDQAIEREQNFAAHAAHELRSPLARLRARLELAQQEADAGSSIESELRYASRACADLERTAEALLSLSRNEASTEDAVDLRDAVEAYRDSLAEPERARLLLEGVNSALVRGDETLIVLAAGNLIDNALKYSGGPVHVTIDTAEDESVLMVEDQGQGIASSDLERVRAPFVRGAAATRRRGGAGLGLALVDHVTELHGAKLELENRVTGGLRATLRFRAWSPSSGMEA